MIAGNGLAPVRKPRAENVLEPGSRRHTVRMATALGVACIALPAKGGEDSPSQDVTPVTVFLTTGDSGG